MKNKNFKKMATILATVVMGIMIIANLPMTAKPNSLSDSVKAMGKNPWYRALIAEQNGRYDGQTDFKFDLVDVDADGSEDLILSYRLSNENRTEVWVWSFNEYVIGDGGYTNEADEIYYCTETKHVKCIKHYPNYTRVQYGQLSILDKDYLTYYVDAEGNYVTVDEQRYMITSVINDETTIETYRGWETTYMPNPVKAVGKYEATEYNLDQYLPNEETVLLGTVTLKVGDAWGISIENIDKLLAEAGYSYKGTGHPTIFYGDRVTMDSQYLVSASGVGVVDANTFETIDFLYIADDEFEEVFQQYESGALTEKYGREVVLVDEAEGLPYYAKAKKAGKTEIVIPVYDVSGGDVGVLSVRILVEIKEQETQESIISSTDANVTIKNENGILPEGTVLTSEKVESGDTFEQAKEMIQEKVEAVENYAVFELDLSDANGAEIHQLSGKVSVTMKLPFELEQGSTLKVFRMEGTELIECSAKVENGMLTFETDHFSTFIFVKQSADTSGENTGTGTDGGSDTDTDAGTGTDEGTDTDEGSDTDTDVDAGTDTDTDTGADNDADVEEDTDTNADAGKDSDKQSSKKNGLLIAVVAVVVIAASAFGVKMFLDRKKAANQ